MPGWLVVLAFSLLGNLLAFFLTAPSPVAAPPSGLELAAESPTGGLRVGLRELLAALGRSAQSYPEPPPPTCGCGLQFTVQSLVSGFFLAIAACWFCLARCAWC